MPRAFIILMDSFGLGSTEDAPPADRGADTLRHIADACFAGQADQAGVRQGPLSLPNFTRLGLNGAAIASQGKPLVGFDQKIAIQAAYGCAKEKSL